MYLNICVFFYLCMWVFVCLCMPQNTISLQQSPRGLKRRKCEQCICSTVSRYLDIYGTLYHWYIITVNIYFSLSTPLRPTSSSWCNSIWEQILLDVEWWWIPMKENNNGTAQNWFLNEFIEITMNLRTWAPKYIVISTSICYFVSFFDALFHDNNIK